MIPEPVRYAVPPWLVTALAVACAVAVVAALDAEAPGRFLFWVLAAATGTEAVRSLLLRPTVAADEHGVTVVSGLRRERHPWGTVVSVGTLAPPSGGGRMRRRAAALEIDLGERLLVVPGYRLGAPVDEVVAALEALRPWGGSTR